MENKLAIRKAGNADIATITRLAMETWPLAYGKILPAAQISYMLELFYNPGALQQQMEKDSFLLAFLEEEPAGFASFGAIDQNVYKLHKLYVKPALQAKGVGKQLVNEVLSCVRRSGACTLELNVNRYNDAKVFYEKLGFEVIREEDIDIGHNYWMNDYVMRINC